MTESIYALDLDELASQGVLGFILDVDNTIVPWRSGAVPPPLRGWFADVDARGIRCCLLSNAAGPRIQRLGADLGVAAVAGASKPSVRGFLAALTVLGTPAGATVVIGDQVFTDVWGGNRAGLRTILVRPLSNRDFLGTRLVRQVERLVRRSWETGQP